MPSSLTNNNFQKFSADAYTARITNMHINKINILIKHC